MKALILAGGAGTRLRPITHTRAKQLVPVANTPILFYGIESMVAAGIVDIGVIIGDTGPEVREALGDGSRFGATITYLPQDAPLGLAHCVLIARDFLADDDFVMYLGDNLLEQDLAAFVDAFESARTAADPPAAQILLKQVPDPHRFGIATLDADGHVLQLVEKPEDPPSDLALVGVYLFDPTIHDAVAAIEPSERGELEITDAIQWLIDQGHRVRCELLTGWWIDTGKLTPLLEANRLLLDKLTTRIDGTVDAALGRRRQGRHRGGVGGRQLDAARPAGDRAQHARRRQLRRPVQRHRRRLRDRQQRDRALRRDGRLEGARHPPAGGQPDRSGGRRVPHPEPSPGAAPDGRRPLPDRRRVMASIVEFQTASAAIDGLVVVTMRQVSDERGTVRELFRASAFETAGVPLDDFRQINVTETRAGAVRGIHAEAMTKLVAVVAGEALGAFVDLRAGSRTAGAVVTVRLVPGTQVLVPSGVGNGFQAVVDGTQYAYCFDREWQPGMAGSACSPLDPALGIEWPVAIDPDDRAQVSAKDVAAPSLAEVLGGGRG